MKRLYHSLFPIRLSTSRKIALLFAAVFFAAAVFYLRPLVPYVPMAARLAGAFVGSSQESLKSQNNRVNILVLGLGGPKNEPSGLTDTILFVSLDQNGGNNVMISLPRDIWIPSLRAKINTVYYYANQSEGVGMESEKNIVSEILGQPVDYAFVISFDGFVKLIDALGGVEVVVDKGFVDDRYPIYGRENDKCGGDPQTLCRYETVVFSQGQRRFNGTEALKFARSRHSEGGEGSDFARAARQQKIVLAVKNRILSPDFFLNPERVERVVQILGDSIDTDITESQMAALARLLWDHKNTAFRSEVLNGYEQGDRPTGFLLHPPISPKYDNQWVLVPRADTWSLTQRWVMCLLQNRECKLEDFTRDIKD